MRAFAEIFGALSGLAICVVSILAAWSQLERSAALEALSGAAAPFGIGAILVILSLALADDLHVKPPRDTGAPPANAGG